MLPGKSLCLAPVAVADLKRHHMKPRSVAPSAFAVSARVGKSQMAHV